MPSLAWIDDFFNRMKDHVFAREEDGVVILPPNQVYKANATGIAIVRHMRAGGRVADIPGIRDPERARQVAAFVSDIRALSLGEPAPGLTPDGAPREPYESVPYTFQYTTLPILGEIAVTYRCNNACLFCYAGCGGGNGCGSTPRAVAAGREMSTAEIKRIIRVFKDDAQIPFFSFTGGEPLSRSDLEELIRFARRLGLEVNLITNGTLATPRRARRLRRAGLSTAQVSLEGLDARTHDALTARPGSFQRTLDGIRSLQAAGISVQTNTTVTAANAADAPRMPSFLRSLGVTRFAMNLFIPSGGSGPDRDRESPSSGDGDHGSPGADHAAALFVPYSRAGAVIETVRTAARREDMTFYWYSPIPHCHYNTIARGLGNKSCAAMDGLLSVSPAGDVLPCSSYPESMGNLLDQGFRDVWFSPRARHFKNKEYAPAECAGCGSFTACQAACPLYWRYAGTAEIRNPAARAREPVRAAAETVAGHRSIREE
jgi:radical SAM protein with 4Fe4S-binding SPASM domain